jgi:hypothetical protein
MTSYRSNEPSIRGTICPLICFGHWIRRSGLISKDSRSSSIRLTVYTTLSTDIRRLEAIDVGSPRNPSARCMSVLFPTPALPIIAMLISAIPLLDWGYISSSQQSHHFLGKGVVHTGKFTELSTDGLLFDLGGGSFGKASSRRRSEYVADLNSRARDID